MKYNKIFLKISKGLKKGITKTIALQKKILTGVAYVHQVCVHKHCSPLIADM